VALAAALACASCTWVRLSPGGAQVKASDAAGVAPCEKLGTVTATVRDRVLFDRSVPKVLSEIRTLARNEAAAMGGDTIVAAGPLERGSPNSTQRFDVYRCR
jgi:hypothetical protein